MRGGSLRLAALLTSLVLISLGGLGLALVEEQTELETKAQLKWIFTNPAEESELSIEVWLDKEVYHLGERLQIHFTISRDCYVYIYDISPQGKVTLLFPNVVERANFLKAGSYVLPGLKQPYSLVTGGRPGVEYIQAIATLEPVPALALPSPSGPGEATAAAEPFPAISTEPEELAMTVRAQLEERASPSGWAADWTSFRLLERERRRGCARLVITSQPSGAEVYLNGRFAGLTPLEAELEPGFVKVELRKAGYSGWGERLHLEGGEVERIEAHLERQPHPLPPPPLPPPEPEPEPEPEEPMVVGVADLPAVGLNIGADWESLGVELGPLGWLRLGVALRLTGEAVPDYYEVEPPPQPWSEERVYNDGPEGEFYLKLVIPIPIFISILDLEGLALELGAGLATQERVHIALLPPPGSGSEPGVGSQDIELKPNGYRTSETYVTALGGVMVRLELVFLELGYHSRRGLLLGVGIDL